MSLLSICKSVCAEVGWPVPQAVASSSDATAQQLFALANTELRALSEVFSWPHLSVEYPFNTVLNQAVYLWPADFRVLAPQAIFNQAQYYEIKGSTGLEFWQLLKYGNLGNLSRIHYRVTYPLGAPGVELTPPPNSIQQLVAVYYSSQYARDVNGVTIPLYSADSDTSKIPERYVELGVKWRFRRAKGLDFSAELSEYQSTINTQYAKYVGAGDIPVGGPRTLSGLTPGYVRESGFGV